MTNLNKNPVLEFALEMQKELDENKHKGKFSWRKDCSLDYLIKRLYEEMHEVEISIRSNCSKENTLSECADVANFAMMIADVYKQKTQK